MSDIEPNWHYLETNIEVHSLTLTKLCQFLVQWSVYLLGAIMLQALRLYINWLLHIH